MHWAAKDGVLNGNSTRWRLSSHKRTFRPTPLLSASDPFAAVVHKTFTYIGTLSLWVPYIPAPETKLSQRKRG